MKLILLSWMMELFHYPLLYQRTAKFSVHMIIIQQRFNDYKTIRLIEYPKSWQDTCTVASKKTKKNKNQLDATYYFIVLLIGSTFFGHYYAHHQELAAIMLIATLVVLFLACCRLEVRCG
jgi:hypothetical protein